MCYNARAAAGRVGQLGHYFRFRSRRGASSRVLSLVAEGRIVPIATLELFLEYEEVLKRPEQRTPSGLTLAELDTALTALASLAEPVDVRFTWRPQLTECRRRNGVGSSGERASRRAGDAQRRRLYPGRNEIRDRVASAWRIAAKGRAMSKATYPLKLPASVKAAATRSAGKDGVSLNQWIASAVAQKVGAVETAAEFFRRRAEGQRLAPPEGDAPWRRIVR